MKFLSVCSGIEAASVAWFPLGWTAHTFAELDKFPSAVLARHYPETPNLGDMTKFKDWPDATFDILVGGTPRQSFSVAGLRKGMADPRGNLALVYLGILDRYRPRWMVWENVPGVLSSNGGRDFGAFLGGLGQLGYGFAYRVLDAQYFGLAQRRKRVFVVGYLGDWKRAAAVLFEPDSLSGHPAPRREAGQKPASTLGTSAARRRGLDDRGDAGANLVAGTIGSALDRHATTQDAYAGNLIAFGGNNQSGPVDVATACRAKGDTGHGDFESETFIAHALRGDGFDASEDGTGRGTPLVPICFDETQITSAENRCNPQPGDPSHPLANGARPPSIAFHARQDPDSGPVTHPLDTDGTSIGIFDRWRVRRLTPRECERLQGFPDGYTAIPYRGNIAADGPRYKALGNSMAVPVMRWIGERINEIDKINEAHNEN